MDDPIKWLKICSKIGLLRHLYLYANKKQRVWIFSLKTSNVLGRNYVYLSILHQNSFIVDYAHHINTTVIFAEMTYSLTSEKQWKQISIRFSS